VKSFVNCFSQHVMGLRDFPDTLLLVIHHFGSDIGNESFLLRCLWSSAATTGFPSFAFW
jgi:hypothetical protein